MLAALESVMLVVWSVGLVVYYASRAMSTNSTGQVLRIAIKIPIVFDLFLLKCRKNGESPLENEDFLLKNGHSLCNLR